MAEKTQDSWITSVKIFLDIRAVTMLFFGFSAGLPLLLIFSSLSLWLREAGVDRSTVTFFSWAALPYSFKFIWSPLVDKLPIPVLSKLMGRRRSWLLMSQLTIILSIVLMAVIDPASSNNSLTFMALAAVLLGFSSATQDIAIDAFRIESAQTELQAVLASTYVAGYRIGMIVAGAGSLIIADYFGSRSDAYSHAAWMNAYFAMAACMMIGVLTTILRPEPKVKVNVFAHSGKDYFAFFFLFLIIAGCFVSCFSMTGHLAEASTKYLGSIFHNEALAGFLIGLVRLSVSIGVAALVAFGIKKSSLVNTDLLEEGYIDPIKNFFTRYGKSLAWLLLAVVGLYRISDIVLGVISNVFYDDMGYSKSDIASAVKTFGVFMAILGGFVGGILTTKLGVIRMLWWGALLSAGTNLLFMLMAKIGNDPYMLYAVVSADNFAAGLASAAFVAFLSSLTDISFTAVQYAIFSSLMTLLPKVLGGYSGSIVDALGYQWFFAFTAALGIPVLYLVQLCGKRFVLREHGKQ